jgi:hypothetical protein
MPEPVMSKALFFECARAGLTGGFFACATENENPACTGPSESRIQDLYFRHEYRTSPKASKGSGSSPGESLHDDWAAGFIYTITMIIKQLRHDCSHCCHL